MTDRRLPMALRNELALHRADASRHREVHDLRRRQRAARWARVEEHLRAFLDRATGRRAPEVCCA